MAIPRQRLILSTLAMVLLHLDNRTKVLAMVLLHLDNRTKVEVESEVIKKLTNP